MMRRVEVVELLQRPPQKPLERRLVRGVGTGKAREVRRKHAAHGCELVDEREEIVRDARSGVCRSKRAVQPEAVAALPDGGFSADAGELLVQYQRPERVMDEF